jgi:hypothetical protein
MKKYLITYPDGTTKECSAVLHQSFLCIETQVEAGWITYKKRTNPDPFDDDEPEYETAHRPKYRTEYKPLFNRAALVADGKMSAAETVVRKPCFADYRGWERYFLTVGENIGGAIITEI